MILRRYMVIYGATTERYNIILLANNERLAYQYSLMTQLLSFCYCNTLLIAHSSTKKLVVF